ncbi:MAG TPA: SH3 domain-containing protein [Candidatus Limnocylindria bacterium]|nr:SH3 domain-containing protein [Candidatus Limnocylindria bacterium]
MKTAHLFLPSMVAVIATGLNVFAAPVAGLPAVTKSDKVNVRALPSRQSEVLGSLPKGQTVTILGTATNAAPDDATIWTKIALPEQVGVWVYGPLIDAKKSVVRAKTANLRAGPGTNYSELGEVAQGESVTVVRKVDEWYQISAPPGSHAYVASNLLESSGTAATEVLTTTKPTRPVVDAVALAPTIPKETLSPQSGILPTETTTQSGVVTKKFITASGQEIPAVVVDKAPPLTPVVPPPEIASETLPAAEPVQKVITTTVVTKPMAYDATGPVVQPPVVYNDQVRKVYREGVVGRSLNPKTPSFYELQSSRKGEGLLDYLITDDPTLILKKYKGHRVVITGEEYVDPNYGDAPIIRVKSIADAP